MKPASLLDVDSIIAARWIIPVNEKKHYLEHHSLIIQHGKILDILPSKQVATRYRSNDEYDLGEHVLIPGLINAHGHSAMTLFRGMADDLPLMQWLEGHIWPAESQWVNADFVRDGTQLAMAEMLRSGTTCFSDMYFYPDACAQAALDLGMRAQVNFPVLDFPTAWAQDAEEYIHKGLELHERFRHQELISVGFGPHAPYTVSDEPLERIATLSEELECSVQIHLHETAGEVSEACRSQRKRPLQRLHELGLLTHRLQCVHMTQVNEQDIQLLQQSNASVIHCPKSNLKLASGFCPSQQLMQAGINVALGTDGAASNNSLNMLEELRCASLLAKAVASDAAALDAHSALEMATINGAKALGIETLCGSLEIGKSADIAALDLSSIECQPVYNPLSQLVYAANSRQFSHVWIDGKLRLKDHQVINLDIERLQNHSRQWRERIRPA